ncbi:orotidine-5'-phosphate decarboxylase [Candidatus Falkowbacteria bacterium]|nr:orotidine-5'-phosphate decarboxylase [Candidatus Falkowbacteria bacterium]
MNQTELLDEARKKIIVAMDVPDIFAAHRVARPLAPHVGMFKIGKQLFTACGPEVIKLIKGMGGEVFLDLKYHDIPNTVAMAGLEAARLGVKMFNLHALGGPEMMETTMKALRAEYPDPENRPKVLAVTILTSSNQETLKAVGIDLPVKEMVVKLAKLAQACGVDGVVCSPQEIELIREACGPDFLIVTPGIRPADAKADDQKRIATPGAAVAAGSNYLVIGRPIIEQPDPVAAAQAITEEIVQVLQQ